MGKALDDGVGTSGDSDNGEMHISPPTLLTIQNERSIITVG